MHPEASKVPNPGATALHEAGHAVVAVRLGIEVEFAEVRGRWNREDDTFSNGLVRTMETDATIDELIAVYAAGMLAELILRGQFRNEVLGSDRKNMREALLAAIDPKAPVDEIGRVIEDAITDGFLKAKEIIEWNELRVLDLADELLERGSLTGSEIKIFLRR